MANLRPSELAVLALIAQGHTYAEIANGTPAASLPTPTAYPFAQPPTFTSAPSSTACPGGGNPPC